MAYNNHASAWTSLLLMLLVALLLLLSSSQERALQSPAVQIGARSSRRLMKEVGPGMGHLGDHPRALKSEDRVAPGGPDPHHHN